MSASHLPGYDIIPDIHGDYGRLCDTLDHLGYAVIAGVWRHPAGRQAAILGDFIDLLGEKVPAWEDDTVKVVDTVRAMVESGSAVAIMGNHELNALLYHEPGANKHGKECDGALCSHPKESFMRHHSPDNCRQHTSFLEAYPDVSSRRAVLDWFLELPVFLDLGAIRLVHACWDPASIAVIARCCPGGRLRREQLAEIALEQSELARAIETVMKGPEVRLPDGYEFHDFKGKSRRHVRLGWWGTKGGTWRATALSVPDVMQLPDTSVPEVHLGRLYPESGVPVFVGHYKITGSPRIEGTNALCLDYVKTPCAYRWSAGEQELHAHNLVTVPLRVRAPEAEPA